MDKLNEIILDIFVYILPIVFIIGNILIRQGSPRGQQILVISTITYVILEIIKYVLMLALLESVAEKAYLRGHS